MVYPDPMTRKHRAYKFTMACVIGFHKSANILTVLMGERTAVKICTQCGCILKIRK